MTQATEKVTIHVGSETIEDTVSFYTREDGTKHIGYAENVKFSYRFRTGAKIHVSSRVAFDQKKGIWFAPSTEVIHNKHAFLVGIYNEEKTPASVKAEWYAHGRNPK